MPLPGFITKIFAGGAKDIINSVTNTIDEFTLSKEEKEKFKAELFAATNAHVEKMAALAQEETNAYLKDVEGARALQAAALSQSDLFSKRFVYYLAIGLLVITFVFDLLFFFIQYPERNHDIINMIAGVINTVGFASVVSFFFGSSKGSEDKQKHINEILSKQ